MAVQAVAATQVQAVAIVACQAVAAAAHPTARRRVQIARQVLRPCPDQIAHQVLHPIRVQIAHQVLHPMRQQHPAQHRLQQHQRLHHAAFQVM